MHRSLALAFTAAILTTSQSPAADKTSGKFENAIAASELVNRTVISKDGVEIGPVSDIVVDREHGRVAFLTVRGKRSPNILESSYFLPPEIVEYSPQTRSLTCTSSFEEIEHYGDLTDVLPMTLIQTTAMSKLFEHYGVRPYWDTAGKTTEKMSLITIDELDGRIVRDTDWQLMARIKEVIVEPSGHWRVAYLSLGELNKADDDQRLAVPMAAFAQKTLSPTWLLDVPGSAELLKKTFTRGEWPVEIDRGWTEFVHVKYGTAPDGGLQDLRDESR